MTNQERFDIHQHITDQIVAAIERGAGEFRLPWHRSAGNIMRPVNVASKKAYRGVNILALWATAEEKGYASGTWGTYRQWSEIGAQVRKGEKAAFIVFYKELEYAAESETGDGETTTRLFARATPSVRGRTGRRLSGPCPRRAAGDHYHADRTGRGVRRRDRCDNQPRRRPGFLPALDRQHPVAAARGVHRHRDQHAGRVVLFHPLS